MNVTVTVHSKPTNFRTMITRIFLQRDVKSSLLEVCPIIRVLDTPVYMQFFWNLDFTILNVLDNVSKSRSSSSFSRPKFSSLALGQIYS
jgi:hypothetical protein